MIDFDSTFIKSVGVVGAGFMGRQIALQIALEGFSVSLYDRDPQVMRNFFRAVRGNPDEMIADKPFLFADSLDPREELAAALQRIQFRVKPEGVADCDLLIEAVSEDDKIKRKVFPTYHALCPERTIFVTNTSSILPSQLASVSGRPDRFAALHFAQGSRLVEIMPHARTSAETMNQLDEFAAQIAAPLIRCRRESRGYVLNRLIMILTSGAIDIVAEGIASPADVDRAFMNSFGATIGPFVAMDNIGLDLVLAIADTMVKSGRDRRDQARADFLRAYVDRGDLGRKTGRGFYEYPNPEFEAHDFLLSGANRKVGAIHLVHPSKEPLRSPSETSL